MPSAPRPLPSFSSRAPSAFGSVRHLLALAPLLLLPGPLFAQQVVAAGSDEFDPDRAFLADSQTFVPFEVTETRPLREALADGTLQGSTRLLVMQHTRGSLALVTDQMAYHHVAQGEIAGEPWMVSFWAVCNTGVGLTPTIDGEVHHFESRGIFNGVSLLTDVETLSVWHHVTGRALAGPLKGRQLPIFNTLQMTVDQALEWDPELEVAISDRPIRRRSRWAPLTDRVRGLSDRFKRSMRGEDARRPTMDIGLGVWSEAGARYYPMTAVNERGRFVFDRFDGQGMLVYIEPTSNSLVSLFTEATSGAWDGDVLRLDDGTWLRAGGLHGPDGVKLQVTRPLQVFTRWYGFALTFPEVTIFGA